MTNDLAALSEAATPGTWTVCVYDCGDTPHYDANGSCPSIQSESEDCAIVHWDGFKQEYWTSSNGNQRQIDANAAFIVTLVNDYRAGRLVQIDREGLRERVARAICERDKPSFETKPRWDKIGVVLQAQFLSLADAAIAAMLGEG